jgi:ribose transport system permease protein
VSVVSGAARVPAPESPLRARARAFGSAPELKRLLVLVAIIAVFAYMNPAFIRFGSLAAIVQAMAFVGIVAVGQTLLIIAGEFDLSVGSTAALVSIVAATLMTQGKIEPVLAMLIGLAVGGLIGLVNATLVLRGRIPSFIATIAMLGIARGLAVWLCGAKPINLPMLSQFSDVEKMLSLSVVLLLVLVVAGHFLVGRSNFGRIICATGGNAEAARIAGVKTLRIKGILFVTSGLLAGLSGILAIIHFGSSTITTGSGWELSAVAAVVVGGTSLFGGGGTVLGTLIGLAILQTITSGLVVVHIDPWWQTVVIGALMLASVGIDSVRRRARPV